MESFDLLVAGILVITVWKVYTDIHNKNKTFNEGDPGKRATSP